MKSPRLFTEDHYKQFCQTLVPISTPYADITSSTSELRPSIKREFFEKVDAFYETFSPELIKAGHNKIQNLSELLKGSFIIGESHSDINPKRYLIENMRALKAAGFNTLYFEHLYYNDQKLLDDFFLTGKMDENLERELLRLGRGHATAGSGGPMSGFYHEARKKYNFINVVAAAQEAGIRVVAIDVQAVYESQNTKDKTSVNEKESTNRMRYMNYTTHEIIKQEQKLNSDGTWLALMGNMHVHAQYDTPGVADLLGVPSLFIFDVSVDRKNPNIPTEVKYGNEDNSYRGYTFKADVMIYAAPDKPLPLFDGPKDALNTRQSPAAR